MCVMLKSLSGLLFATFIITIVYIGGGTFSEIENESEMRSEIVGKSTVKLKRLSHDSVTHNGWYLVNLPVGSFRLFPRA